MGIEIKKLLGNRIMIDPETLEQSTKSGIILPASMIKEKQGVGVILMIGEEVFHEHESEKLVVGQKVLYGKLAGSEMEYEGNHVKVIRSTDVSAILEEVDETS